MSMLAAVVFLLSFWAIPAALVIVALVCANTMWIKVVAIAVGALWLMIFHPWTMMRGPRFADFINDLRHAFYHLFSH